MNIKYKLYIHTYIAVENKFFNYIHTFTTQKDTNPTIERILFKQNTIQILYTHKRNSSHRITQT